MDITRRLHVRKSFAIVVSTIVVVLNAIHVNMFMIGILVNSKWKYYGKKYICIKFTVILK